MSVIDAAKGSKLYLNGAAKTGVLGWVSFDFAVIPCFGLINIFIFAPYFALNVVGDPIRGQAMWGYGQATAGLLIALLAPILGAAADTIGARKPLLLKLALTAGAAMASLAFMKSGDPFAIWFLLAGIVIFSTCIEYMVVLHNTMLPSLVPENALGTWSGWGFSIGYGATVLALILIGSILPTEICGVSRERALGPLMAAWMCLSIWPLFAFTPDQPRTNIGLFRAGREGTRALMATAKKASSYKNIWRYFIARAIFYDGLLAVFVFSGIFAAGIFGWHTKQLAVLGITQFVAAAIGAAIGGPIDDHFGSKRTLFLSILMGTVGTTLMLLISSHGFLNLALLPTLSKMGFASEQEQAYLFVAGITYFFTGPALASSRTMVVRLAPREQMGQFFGLFSMLGRSTSFAAPLIIGAVTSATGDQRLGFSMVILFMVIGMMLLIPVKEQRSPAI